MEPNVTPAAPAAPATPPSNEPIASNDPSGFGGADVAIAALTRGAAPAAPAAEPAAPAAPAVPAEPAVPAAPAAPAPADELAARIERAMSARAETVERLRAAESERETLRAEREAAAAEVARYRQLARENLPELLRAEGWTPEAIVQAMSDIHSPRPEVVRGNQLEQRLAAIEADNQKLRGEIAAREHADKVSRFKGSIVPALKAKTEAYSHSLEFFDPEPLQELVFAEIEREYQGSGGTKVLSIEEAADRIESQLRARVSRVKGLGKAAEPTVAPPAPSTPQPATRPAAPKTLTNDLNGSTAHAPEFDPLQDEARLMQAADILRKGWT